MGRRRTYCTSAGRGRADPPASPTPTPAALTVRAYNCRAGGGGAGGACGARAGRGGVAAGARAAAVRARLPGSSGRGGRAGRGRAAAPGRRSAPGQRNGGPGAPWGLAATSGMSVALWRLTSIVPCLFSVVPVVARDVALLHAATTVEVVICLSWYSCK